MGIGLSVVIACYNCEKTIERCLLSIPQDMDTQVILIDDCSTDLTAEIIKKYIKNNKNENVQYYLNADNLGAGLTRNIGVSLATKEYITFLDSDDEFSEDFAITVRDVLNERNYDCIVFDASKESVASSNKLKMFYSPNITEGQIKKKDAVVFVKGAPWGKIYRTNVIKNNNIQFGEIPINEDLIFTKTAIANCESIYYIEKPLYKYIDNNNSLMHNSALLNEKNAFIAFDTIKSKILTNGLNSELNSIYFLEVVYSSTLTQIALGKSNAECRMHFRSVEKRYDKNDPYRKRYFKKYIIAYYLFKNGCFDLFRLLLRKHK